MNQEQFADNIRNWAEARDLLTPDNAVKQAAKMGEEIGEVIGAIVKGNAEAIKMELGDIEVLGAILAAQIGHDAMVLALAQPHPSGDVFRQLSLMQLNGYSLLDAALDFIDSGKTSGRHKLEDELHDILGCSRGLMKILGFDEDECRALVWEKISGRSGKTVDGVFIKD